MRLAPFGTGVLVLIALGCMGGDPPGGLVREVPPSVLELEAWAGRWEALTEREGQTVVFTPCDRANHFVEVRSDGEGGWEVLAGVGGELRIGAVTAVEAVPEGVRITVDGGEPLTIGWVEPERTATMTPLFEGERFVAPRHRAEVPVVAQDCP